MSYWQSKDYHLIFVVVIGEGNLFLIGISSTWFLYVIPRFPCIETSDQYSETGVNNGSTSLSPALPVVDLYHYLLQLRILCEYLVLPFLLSLHLNRQLQV